MPRCLLLAQACPLASTSVPRALPKLLLDETRGLFRDGNCVIARAALSHLDLMLAVVYDMMGKSGPRRCSRYMLIEQRSSQTRYMMQDIWNARTRP